MMIGQPYSGKLNVRLDERREDAGHRRLPPTLHCVILFDREDDARRVLAVLPERFGKYGLTLHPQKTRLVRFLRPSVQPPQGGSGDGKGTFDLLGFTHYWEKSHSGYWVVKLKTAKGRFGRALQRVADWCRLNRHLDVRQQWDSLKRKLQGHYQYYGVAGNGGALWRFRHEVYGAWRCWLNRRSQRARVTWAKMRVIHARYPLPQPPATLKSLRA
jgi:RNA-directed DNA polymerase